MPIETSRVQPGIYVFRWVGAITVREMLEDGTKAAPRMADEDGCEKYVYVLDVSEMTNIPFDIGNMRRATANNAPRQYTIIVGASYGVHVLTKIVSRFTDYNVSFADDMDDALAQARERLEKIEAGET